MSRYVRGVMAWLRRNLGAVLRFCATIVALGWAGQHLHAAWGSTPMPGLAAGPGEWALALAAGGAALLLLSSVSAAGVVALGLVPRAGALAFGLAWTRLWFVSYLYRYIPGKLVLIAERVRMGRAFGIGATPSVLLVVWESGLLLAGAAVFAALGYAGVPLPADAPLTQGQAVLAAVVCLVGLLLFPYELRWAARRFPWLAARLPGLVLEVPIGAQLALVGANAVCWGLLGLCFALTARLFDNPAPVSALPSRCGSWCPTWWGRFRASRPRASGCARRCWSRRSPMSLRRPWSSRGRSRTASCWPPLSWRCCCCRSRFGSRSGSRRRKPPVSPPQFSRWRPCLPRAPCVCS